MAGKCRIFIIAAVLLVLLNVNPTCCKAQGTPLETPQETDTPTGIDPVGDPDAPIDGGLGLLLAIGVGYGLKKTNDQRKKIKWLI